MLNPFAPLIYLLIYLLFFYVRPHEYPGWQTEFTFMPTLLALGLLTALFQPRNIVTPKYGLLLMGLMISVFISIAKSGWIGGGISAAAKFAPVALLGFVVSRSIRTIEHFRAVAFTLTLLGGFLAIYGINQVTEEIGWSGVTLIHGRIRYLGPLADPNDMANVLLLSLTMALYLTFGKETALLARVFSLTCAVLVIWGIVLTGSRGAFLAIAAMLTVYFILNRSNWKRILPFPIIIIAFLIALPDRLLNESLMDESSSAGRIFAWSVGLNLLKSNPIFGVGYGQFMDFHTITAHNSAVLAFAELGIFGYLIWISLVILAFLSAWKIIYPKFDAHTPKSDNIEIIKMNQAAAQAVFYGLIGVVTTAMFLSRTYMPILYLNIGLAVGLYGVAAGTDERLKPIEIRHFLLRSTVVGLGFIAVIYIAVRLGTLRFTH